MNLKRVLLVCGSVMLVLVVAIVVLAVNGLNQTARILDGPQG